MEQSLVSCRKCHAQVRDADYFCFNCGVNLQPAPPPVGLGGQLVLYLKSMIVPPLGIYWAIPYLRQKNVKSKVVGMVAIIITLVALLVLVVALKNFSDSVNKQINSQLDLMQL